MVLTLERTSKLANLSHTLLTIVGSGAVICSVIGLTIPTMHRDKDNIWHVMKNWGAIGLIASSGLTMVWASKQLEWLNPEINAIEKAQIAQGKHSIASWLFQANKLNSDIAQSLISENSPVQQRQQAEILEAAFQEGLQRGYDEAMQSLPETETAISRNGETGKMQEISNLSPELIEMVQIEILDGKSESKIIMETLGMRGRNYKQGREIVRQIKRLMESDHE
ncbi:hypothetical protein [Limnoraphis robusta]|uniref:Uncharacterized protein n=1 Tax=Limnoraphis robusta CCNP1315 TaxID=3110306 RepID=A0ABU5TVL4_9CYAN|nr:hypothetical protein [Limnoraphis robusta]MEA5518745.1 hypothetical protein [Limnoraphis robusta CCNP1315]MEA5544258.1 hypothetical protein [Limnoraphis robusta CCNP1324]